MTMVSVPVPHQVSAVPIYGQPEHWFPVRRIYCVGQNYAEHTREMGHDPDRETPFFFSKPADAVAISGSTIPFPPMTQELHHEVEMVVAIEKAGSEIAVADALQHVFGYCVGFDMTRRDLQAEAKRTGRPWDLAKGFDNSMPCGPLYPVTVVGHPERGLIQLEVDGAVRQEGDIGQLIWSVPEIISVLSRYVSLKPGDLIMTGTPAGVGPVHPGSRLTGSIEGLGSVEIAYARSSPNGEHE